MNKKLRIFLILNIFIIAGCGNELKKVCDESQSTDTGKWFRISNSYSVPSSWPLPRGRAGAIWTGKEMFVGFDCSCSGKEFGMPACGCTYPARYNPELDMWFPVSIETPENSWLDGAPVVWTGKKIIFSGESTLMYDPEKDIWLTMSRVGSPPELAKGAYKMVWTGKEVIMYGSYYANNEWFNAGGRYDPETDIWKPMNIVGAPEPRFGFSAIWTGKEMIIWGGEDGDKMFNSGGKYDPLTDTWSSISTSGSPTGRKYHTAVWTGTEMIIWGGSTDRSSGTNTGGRYNPEIDTWASMSTLCAPEPRAYHTALWTGKEMIIWGGSSNDSKKFNWGGRYNPETDTWIPIGSEDIEQSYYSSVWTGTEMIIWGEGFGWKYIPE